MYGYYNVDIHQYLQMRATVQRYTCSTADDFQISINSARTEKPMEYYFHCVFKPWNTIPCHVRSTRCNNNEIVPFKICLTKHSMHLTLTRILTMFVLSADSFCRCSGCRPVWMKHTKHTCSTVPPPLPTNPHAFYFYECALFYVVSVAMQVAPSGESCVCGNVPRIIAIATATPSFPQDLI